MFALAGRLRRLLPVCLFAVICGCAGEAREHPLNEELARDSVRKAMQAWVDGKTPADVKSEMIVGDSAWDKGEKLLGFKLLPEEETTDGSNLHIRVVRTFDRSGKTAESKVTYIVGTSPVVTIFPQ